MIDLRSLPKTWDECTDEQKKFFEELGKNSHNLFAAALTKKCWLCKQKYDKPLYDFGSKKHWNYPFLVHLKVTHGLDPEIIETIVLS